MILFIFDSGIRSPTELLNVRVSDLYNDCKELNIRQDISKTFGRKIKLMICSKVLKEHIQDKKLNPEDYVFDICPSVVNRYLKRLAGKLFGDKPSLAGQKYSELTLYDFRHISCCYWLPKYKSESALKYRFGWKKSDKIHYYSEFLGMKDTISEDDLLIDTTKTELERRLTKTEKEETGYLADGLNQRNEEILKGLDMLRTIPLPHSPQKVERGCLVRLNDGHEDSDYFILPYGGGESIVTEHREVTVLSPSAPLGKVMLNKTRREKFNNVGKQQYTIVEIL